MTTSSTSAALESETDDYRYSIETSAASDVIIEALTDEQAISRWWTCVTRAERDGDEIRLFMGGEVPLVFTVDHVAGRDDVSWTVTACDFLSDWVGTKPTFSVRQLADGASAVEFQHVGLRPALECFEDCRSGWNHFMPSLRQYLETGTGLPNQPRQA
jgi:hypothetical protein